MASPDDERPAEGAAEPPAQGAAAPPVQGAADPPVEADTGRGAALPQPGGLLGLLLWPLRAAISLGLAVFAAFVEGVIRAMLPGRDAGDGAPDRTAGSTDTDAADDPPPSR